MTVNVIVQYNGGFLRYFTFDPSPNVVWFNGTIISYVITTLLNMYFEVLHCVMFCFVWWPCMAINVRVQFNGGLTPDIYC